MTREEFIERLQKIQMASADLAAQANAIKQEAVVVAIEMDEIGKSVETVFPPSEARDNLMAVIANLRTSLCELSVP